MTLSVRIVLFFSFFGTASQLVSARETVYSNINCAITFPLGWESFPVDRVKYFALVKSPDGIRSVLLQARTIDPRQVGSVDEEFRQEARRAFSRDAPVAWEKPMMIVGQPGMEIAGTLLFLGTNVSTVGRIVIAGDKAYKVMIMFMGGDAAADQDLQACLNSFRLLRAPQPPPGASGPTAVFLEVFLAAVILGGVWFIQRRRRRACEASYPNEKDDSEDADALKSHRDERE